MRPPTITPVPLRVAVGVFALLLLVYGWFHQGGGWNQNSRFDQVRAIVESGSLAIDDYMLWDLVVDERGAVGYRRLPVSEPTTEAARMPRVNTLDVSLYEGHYTPNKPPGLVFAAAPVYALLLAVERTAGLDPDAWGVVTFNLYAVTVLTVGVAGALGGVLFLVLAGSLFPEVSLTTRVLATLALFLGTLILPYATILIDHVPDVTLALASLLLVWRSRPRAAGEASSSGALFAAGTLAGTMIVFNYSLVISVVALGAWALWLTRPRLRIAAWVAGGVAPALALAAYHAAAYGSPFTLVHDHQMAVFQEGGDLFLGMFGVPRLDVAAELLVLPYRGLFFSSPLLLLSLLGLVQMIRSPERRVLGLLCAATALAYLLLISSMNGWHGGNAFGSRYLTPALPFLGLALVPAFHALPRLSCALASVSLAVMLLVTAVNVQPDPSVRRPFRDFYLPLAAGGSVATSGYRMQGPVSVHPLGVPAGELEVMAPITVYARWNAFNVGELVFPHSWASLLPMLLGAGALGAATLRGARRAPPR